MNLYDFDKTIYKKDSSIQFYFYCLQKKPYLFFHVIYIAFLFILNKFKLMSTKIFKEKFFGIVKYFKNVPTLVNSFWKKQVRNINSFYLKQKSENDVICSASPEFLIKPAIELVNSKATVVCTNFDIDNLKIVGENLKGINKVTALRESLQIENLEFDAVYTDSLSDFPILDLTNNKFIVCGSRVYRFGEQKPTFCQKIKYLIKLLRPKHYIKNCLIFLPLFFGKKLININSIFLSIAGFVSFCLIASFVYVINDLLDAKKDRLHSKKRTRPIASFMVKPTEAIVLAIALLFISIAINISLWGPISFAMVNIAIYAIINLLYSVKLKNIPIIDVFVLSLCYLLRIFYGGVIVDAPVSKWLYLTILCGALFMGFGKRRNEILKENNSRHVNKFYNYNFLDKNLYICLAMCLVFYSLWAIDVKPTVNSIMNGYILLATIPLVYFIMMRYSFDIEKIENSGDPIDVLLSDKILILSCVLFVVLVVISIYVPIKFVL